MEQLNVYVLCGAPGSGKSTWADEWVSKNPNTIRVCPDVFRAKLGRSESDQSVSAQAFSASKRAVGEALDAGKNVVFDATNMYRKTRKDFLDVAAKYNAKTIAVVFEIDEKIAIERNKKRADGGGRDVPTDIIRKMLSRYERPTNEEFDEVIFINKIKTKNDDYFENIDAETKTHLLGSIAADGYEDIDWHHNYKETGRTLKNIFQNYDAKLLCRCPRCHSVDTMGIVDGDTYGMIECYHCGNMWNINE